MKVNLKILFLIGSFFLIILSFLVGLYFKQVMNHKVVIPFIMQDNMKMSLYVKNNVPNISYENILSQNDFNNIYNHLDNLDVLPFLKINILNAEGKQEISNNNSKIFYEYSNEDEELLLNAKNGKIDNRYIDSAIFEDEATNRSIFTIVRTLLPIRNNNGKILFFIETFYDITQLNKIISSMQIILVGGFTLFALMFIMILFYLTSRSQSIIIKQHEANVELEQAKLKAELANEEKSKFLTNISHELRTPLNAIIGFSQIIKDETLGEVSNKQYLEYSHDIHNSGVHLLSLINDILDYSKAEANKLTIDIQEIDLNKVIESSMRMVESRADEAGVVLKKELPEEHIVMHADQKRLKQVLLNLLSNAVKFTQSGKEVVCTANINRLEEAVIIVVKDNGIGIEAKDISRAMSTFGQIDSELSRKFEGTGLGLPLTKKLVELMKGDFNIVSESGIGTTITLTFPL